MLLKRFNLNTCLSVFKCSLVCRTQILAERYRQPIFAKFSGDYSNTKTMNCLIKAFNKTKTESADNGQSEGLLTTFDCWHINRPLSRPTGRHWLL